MKRESLDQSCASTSNECDELKGFNCLNRYDSNCKPTKSFSYVDERRVNVLWRNPYHQRRATAVAQQTSEVRNNSKKKRRNKSSILHLVWPFRDNSRKCKPHSHIHTKASGLQTEPHAPIGTDASCLDSIRANQEVSSSALPDVIEQVYKPSGLHRKCSFSVESTKVGSEQVDCTQTIDSNVSDIVVSEDMSWMQAGAYLNSVVQSGSTLTDVQIGQPSLYRTAPDVQAVAKATDSVLNPICGLQQRYAVLQAESGNCIANKAPGLKASKFVIQNSMSDSFSDCSINFMPPKILDAMSTPSPPEPEAQPSTQVQPFPTLTLHNSPAFQRLLATGSTLPHIGPTIHDNTSTNSSVQPLPPSSSNNKPQPCQPVSLFSPDTSKPGTSEQQIPFQYVLVDRSAASATINGTHYDLQSQVTEDTALELLATDELKDVSVTAKELQKQSLEQQALAIGGSVAAQCIDTQLAQLEAKSVPSSAPSGGNTLSIENLRVLDQFCKKMEQQGYGAGGVESIKAWAGTQASQVGRTAPKVAVVSHGLSGKVSDTARRQVPSPTVQSENCGQAHARDKRNDAKSKDNASQVHASFTGARYQEPQVAVVYGGGIKRSVNQSGVRNPQPNQTSSIQQPGTSAVQNVYITNMHTMKMNLAHTYAQSGCNMPYQTAQTIVQQMSSLGTEQNIEQLPQLVYSNTSNDRQLGTQQGSTPTRLGQRLDQRQRQPTSSYQCPNNSRGVTSNHHGNHHGHPSTSSGVYSHHMADAQMDSTAPLPDPCSSDAAGVDYNREMQAARTELVASDRSGTAKLLTDTNLTSFEYKVNAATDMSATCTEYAALSQLSGLPDIEAQLSQRHQSSYTAAQEPQSDAQTRQVTPDSTITDAFEIDGQQGITRLLPQQLLPQQLAMASSRGLGNNGRQQILLHQLTSRSSGATLQDGHLKTNPTLNSLPSSQCIDRPTLLRRMSSSGIPGQPINQTSTMMQQLGRTISSDTSLELKLERAQQKILTQEREILFLRNQLMEYGW